MDLIRKMLQFSSARYLVTVSESLAIYILTILEYVLNMFFSRSFSSAHIAIPPVRSILAPLPETRVRKPVPITNRVDQDCQNWFMSLCGQRPGIMTHTDVLNFCESINKSPSDMVFLVLACKMGAKNAGIFTEQEWVRGMRELNISSSVQLLNKWESLRGLLDDLDTEKSVYRFSYDYSRERERDGNRIEVGTAIQLITLFFAHKWKYCKPFIQYLKLSKIRSLTRDQYINVLDFSRSISSLTYYDEAAAWPVLMDEFVAHYTTQPELYHEKTSFSIPDQGAAESGKIKFAAQFESGSFDWKM